tara:strand:- start:4079 stop:4747 length:669 start_codon:yes stop_codon:yes gene_type:complete
MVPTRGRVEHLNKMLYTLFSSVSDPNCIEAVMRVDEDDVETQDYLADKLNNNIKMIVGERYRGYVELNRFYNEIAEQARGTWLFLSNDDLYFNKTDWDLQLAKIEEVLVLNPKTMLNGSWLPAETGNTFPIMHKRIHEVLGYFCPCFLNDAYTSKLAKSVELERYAPFIEIIHTRGDLNEHNDVVVRESMGIPHGTYEACEEAHLHGDIEKILNSDLKGILK